MIPAGSQGCISAQPDGPGEWVLAVLGHPGEAVGSAAVDSHLRTLNHFLKGVEKRAFRRAEIATGSADEALDIVQDAMLRLVQRYAARPEDEWAPLFQRILHSRIMDWHRRRKVRQLLVRWTGTSGPEAEPPEAPDERAAGPEQSLAGSQELRRLESALRTLPPRQQQVFLLRAWEGLDVRETARVMGCSEGSVKTHYARARQALQTQLKEASG